MTAVRTDAAPDIADVRSRAWQYALSLAEHGKLTDTTVANQPNEGPMWERYPLTRVANNVLHDRSFNDRIVVSIRLKGKTPTQAQVRALVNLAVSKYRRGYRAEWMGVSL